MYRELVKLYSSKWNLLQMEGMVGKRLEITYVGRRSADWQKVIRLTLMW